MGVNEIWSSQKKEVICLWDSHALFKKLAIRNPGLRVSPGVTKLRNLGLDFGRHMKLQKVEIQAYTFFISTASLRFPFQTSTILYTATGCRQLQKIRTSLNLTSLWNTKLVIGIFENFSFFSINLTKIYFPYSKLFFIDENFLLKIFQSISTFPMKIGSLILHAMQSFLRNKQRLSTIST